MQGPLGRSKPDLPTYCIGCHRGLGAGTLWRNGKRRILPRGFKTRTQRTLKESRDFLLVNKNLSRTLSHHKGHSVMTSCLGLEQVFRKTKRKTEGPQHLAFPEISRENRGCLFLHSGTHLKHRRLAQRSVVAGPRAGREALGCGVCL